MNKDSKRELTAAEKARSIKFEKAKQDLAARGYRETNLTMSVEQANMLTLVLAGPIALVLVVLFWAVNPEAFPKLASLGVFDLLLRLALFMVVFLLLVPLHELIHGITWAAFAKKHWKAISFGIIMAQLTPYCSCDEALGRGQYMTGTLMPTIVLGVIPAVWAVFSGSAELFIMAALMILSGGGDLAIVSKVLSFDARGKQALYMDHPYEVGLVAFTK